MRNTSAHWMATIQNKCGTTNITTGAIVSVGAAKLLGQDCGKITYYNGSTSVIGLFAGSIQIATLYPGANAQGLEVVIPNNSQMGLKALDATASSGTVQVDFFT